MTFSTEETGLFQPAWLLYREGAGKVVALYIFSIVPQNIIS